MDRTHGLYRSFGRQHSAAKPFGSELLRTMPRPFGAEARRAVGAHGEAADGGSASADALGRSTEPLRVLQLPPGAEGEAIAKAAASS